MRCITSLNCLLALPLLAADAPSGKPPAKVDDMSQAAVQSAFQVLSREYIRKEDLTFEHLNRVALEGLLRRLDFGAELVRKAESKVVLGQPLLAEVLAPGVAYLRPRQLGAEDLSAMQERLKEWSVNAAVQHVLLDLREPMPAGEFTFAQQVLELFLPRDVLLYKLKHLAKNDKAELAVSSAEPSWKRKLLVLVDEDTNNQSETIAAVLQQQGRALLLGNSTRGATVRYETVPLDELWQLRFASAEMLLADERSLFRKGVQPELRLVQDLDQKRKQFRHTATRDLIKETPRARYNEVALVHGQNPELTDFLLRSKGEELPTDQPQPKDTVLQRALDLCLATDHLAVERLDWKVPATSTKKSEVKKAQPVN